MKKLLIIILIISLPLIAFFQYKSYKRFHPAVSYDYDISEQIDVNYYNQSIVDEYYAKAVEIGAFARIQWRSNDVDVRFPNNENLEEMNAGKYYNQLLARVSLLEAKLTQSLKWKTEGLSNEAVKLLESGYARQDLKWLASKESLIQVAFGDQSKFVWQVQQALIEKGYEHTLDGLFGGDTQNAILSFQQDNNLYPSGTLDEETFDLLFF